MFRSLLTSHINKPYQGEEVPMKCFTYHGGEVSEGFQMSTIAKPGKDPVKAVFLGQYGSSSKSARLQLDKFNPAETKVIDGTVYVTETFLTKPKLKDDGKIRYRTLGKFDTEKAVDSKNEDTVLLRACTSSPKPQDDEVWGNWRPAVGRPVAVVEASGGSEKSKWKDDIILMRNNDVIHITDQGGINHLIQNQKGKAVLIGCSF